MAGGAGGEVAAQLGSPRDDVLPVGDAAREQVLDEVADGGLGRPLRRPRALQLETDQVAHEPQQRRRGLLAARPVAQAPTSASATRSSTISVPASPAITARSSSGDAHATASTLLPGSSTITLASSALLAARATGGQPGAGLDRVRDLVEGLEEGARPRRHHAYRFVAPDDQRSRSPRRSPRACRARTA